MSKITIYELCPDFRREAPKHPTPYCACCQQEVNPATSIKVTVDWGSWDVTEGWDMLPKLHQRGALIGKENKELDNTYVGATCWKKIKRRFKREQTTQ